MVSLGDFASLSERMCAVFNDQEPFGGKHIVVTSGKRSQSLPPLAYPYYNVPCVPLVPV
jgi:hypothetical protein